MRWLLPEGPEGVDVGRRVSARRSGHRDRRTANERCRTHQFACGRDDVAQPGSSRSARRGRSVSFARLDRPDGALLRILLDLGDLPTRHNYGLGLPQYRIERTLAGWVGELGVPIYRGRELSSGHGAARILRVLPEAATCTGNRLCTEEAGDGSMTLCAGRGGGPFGHCAAGGR